MAEELLAVHNLKAYFFNHCRPLRAVDGLDLTVHKGETVGLIGESGCGKTTTALAILQLLPDGGEIRGGQIIFAGKDLLQAGPTAIRSIRGGQIGMVFQDPMTSLNPVLTVGEQIMEAVRLHPATTRRAARAEAVHLLEMVGLPQPAYRLRQYPHQLSGGMRQRVLMAMAIAGQPSLLIADEPVAALDAPLQVQILQLIDKLKQQLSMTVLLITHNVSLATTICDRIVVMYAGKTVETAPVTTVLNSAVHPYTQGLIAAVPRFGAARLKAIGGSVPDLVNPPTGCRFHPRCPVAQPICSQYSPPMVQLSAKHSVSCWLATERQ